LIAGWEDVETHDEWIASEGNKELLKLLEPYLKVQGMVHLALKFQEIPEGIEAVKLERVEDGKSEDGGADGAWSVVVEAVDILGLSYRLTMCRKGDVTNGRTTGVVQKVELG
jgi:hypothetical protein